MLRNDENKNESNDDVNFSVKHNESLELQSSLLDSFSIIRFEEVTKALMLAADNSSWDDLSVLLNYASTIELTPKNSKDLENFKFELGKVLMIAVEKNNTQAVKEILSFHILKQGRVSRPETNRFQYSFKRKYRRLFFRKNNGKESIANLLRYQENQFTVLHQAVKKNNAEICLLLLKAWNAADFLARETDSYYASIKFHNKNYILLCKAKDTSGQTAYAMALHLGNTECAKAIAVYHDWGYVRSREDTETIFKTLFHNISFGYIYKKLNKDGAIRNFSGNYFFNPPICIAQINKYKHYKQPLKYYWHQDYYRTLFFESSMLLSEQEKMQFLQQAMNKNTALGSLYAAQDPYTCTDLKIRMKKELDQLRTKNISCEVKIDSYLDANTLINVPVQQQSVNDHDGYSKYLRDYLKIFDTQKSFSIRIAELDLTPAEEFMFEEFTDPITDNYMNRPVSLHERFYDLDTISPLAVDPFSHQKFLLRDIQTARQLLIKFDETVEKLKNIRACKEDKQNMEKSMSMTNIDLCSPSPVIHDPSLSITSVGMFRPSPIIHDPDLKDSHKKSELGNEVKIPTLSTLSC